MTKKCTIFSGGEAVSAQCVAEYKPFIDDSLVISADKGYKLAQAVGVKSDIIMGDFDSAEKPVFDNIEIDLFCDFFKVNRFVRLREQTV